MLTQFETAKAVLSHVQAMDGDTLLDTYAVLKAHPQAISHRFFSQAVYWLVALNLIHKTELDWLDITEVGRQVLKAWDS